MNENHANNPDRCGALHCRQRLTCRHRNQKTGESSAGTVLTNGDGLSLYVFDKGTASVSNCNGGCADKWPPAAAKASARPQGEFGIVVRADGKRQWTYQGRPLYTWIKDAQVGDVTGGGVKGVWHLERP